MVSIIGLCIAAVVSVCTTNSKDTPNTFWAVYTIVVAAIDIYVFWS